MSLWNCDNVYDKQNKSVESSAGKNIISKKQLHVIPVNHLIYLTNGRFVLTKWLVCPNLFRAIWGITFIPEYTIESVGYSESSHALFTYQNQLDEKAMALWKEKNNFVLSFDDSLVIACN